MKNQTKLIKPTTPDEEEETRAEYEARIRKMYIKVMREWENEQSNK